MPRECIAERSISLDYAFADWEHISARLKGAQHLAVFLDFDGTLVTFRRRPADVSTPRHVKRILGRLVRHKNVFVAIVSGRRFSDLRNLLGIQGLEYAGSHGGEVNGKTPILGSETRQALARAKQIAQEQMRSLPNVAIEDKGISFAVHFRGAATATVNKAKKALAKIMASSGNALRVLHGSCVWEILPREIPGKSQAVKELLSDLPAETVSVCLGDDETDELMFAVLKDQITIRVGFTGKTRARYYLRGPADVSRFLTLLERILQ